MNTIYPPKLTHDFFNSPRLTHIGLLSVVFGACILATGCGSGSKKKIQQSQPVVLASQLDSPSSTYLSGAIKLDSNSKVTAEQWMTIANSNYKSKKYARALRAATEALSINDKLVDARQLAMLSAVKVTESNIDSYHDNAMMNNDDKAELKTTLADITTLINTSD